MNRPGHGRFDPSNRRRIMLVAVVLPATVGLGTVYRDGEWSVGPASPEQRESCDLRGGDEVDLFLIHHCASAAPRPSTLELDKPQPEPP
ncbi:MAG TPA: hypothetical protein VHV82_08125 [Sporichthyaceae bacterium]|nr:hypothetical protein [Sporichthyaceae bacterium]